jgi:hypothetical protein
MHMSFPGDFNVVTVERGGRRGGGGGVDWQLSVLVSY